MFMGPRTLPFSSSSIHVVRVVPLGQLRRATPNHMLHRDDPRARSLAKTGVVRCVWVGDAYARHDTPPSRLKTQLNWPSLA